MLILVVVVIPLAYFKCAGLAKRRVWTEKKVDQRMSTNWKSMLTADANFAIRHSMADSGNRNSSLLFRSNPSAERCLRWRSGLCRCNGFVYSSKRFSLANVPSPTHPPLKTVSPAFRSPTILGPHNPPNLVVLVPTTSST